MTTLVRSRAEFMGAREGLTGPIGLVPTMGALHAGHRANMAQARELCESVIVTIFVNPLQFAPTEDLAVYPRTLDDDVAMCEQAGVDVVWAPPAADVYPDGTAQVRVDPGPLGAELEGAVRPEHFSGVLTVVAKLLNLTRPAVAFFGEKDYQQLTLIRRMAADLELGVGIAGVPTVREADGLALSSRNVFLSADDRRSALALSRALQAGIDAAPRGAVAVMDAGRAVLAAEPKVAVDYLALRGPDLGPAPEHGEARLLVAARVGRTRLIDNMAVTL
ncbi:MAG: pantoate--beta-alanine ligase [Pseudonocardiales bacterium]|jgi:pantoate--beta-alanine ligase|nr:panC [Pseudonocardiales bacterium]MDT4908030.1 pantoate--beta-alanine ligase [Pseudonocardiales bacterium]MDT4960502.1 pantoate--beta-alanine ligase [Pseudonocardiales bacterium]MDT4969879.1 pantoate--beta-alanine ligase [Pseudonocardiales bacterium]MDT4975785.1 pantoate--beta-alanine ligase [Pseudonocardiales bacterium]